MYIEFDSEKFQELQQLTCDDDPKIAKLAQWILRIVLAAEKQADHEAELREP